MSTSPTFTRRYEEALRLAATAGAEEALTALEALFAALPDPFERRVASADFCLDVELNKAELLAKLGRVDDAFALLDDDGTWRLANEAGRGARLAFLEAHRRIRELAGRTPLQEPAGLRARLESIAFGPHRIHGWEVVF